MKKISITLLLCLLCLTGMAQGQKALDLKDITSGRFRPENIQGVSLCLMVNTTHR